MEENVNLDAEQQPNCEEPDLPSDAGATTPDIDRSEHEEAFVEVKFNKQHKRISLEQAAELAQKGMKYDLVADEYEKLKALSRKAGLSPKDYLARMETEAADKRRQELIERCAGNTELAEHILSLEGGEKPSGLEELRAEFPEIADETAVPEEVKTAAQIKGTGLLFEYLLFEHRLRRAAKEEVDRRERTAGLTTGSLARNDGQTAVDTEFLKGIWGK